MLAHRLRRWPNIKPTLGQRLVLTGVGRCVKGGPVAESVRVSCGLRCRTHIVNLLWDAKSTGTEYHAMS